MRRVAFWLGIAALLSLAAVSAATPSLHYDYWWRWFALPGVLLTAQVPLLVVISAATFFWSLKRGSHRLPFPWRTPFLCSASSGSASASIPISAGIDMEAQAADRSFVAVWLMLERVWRHDLGGVTIGRSPWLLSSWYGRAQALSSRRPRRRPSCGSPISAPPRSTS